MSAAFTRLHPKIQEAVWNLGWGELRPLQVNAIQAVLDGCGHVILSAATASGKTEAAFLPLLSLVAEAPEGSVQALYISPLKALINDQFRRLEDLCTHAQIPVHRWHGDVGAADKQRLRKSPGGVLLITPESLESQFINHSRFLTRMYAGLRFVVIDELHAFLGNVRGVHLRSLLARLEIEADVNPRRLGLSATIGDYEPARAFLCPAAPDKVVVIEDRSQDKELRLGLKAYLDTPETRDDEVAYREGDPRMQAGLWGVATDVAQRFRNESNLIFCNSRRQTELLADKLRQVVEHEGWPRNPFLLHHGSLSRELREDVEHELKSGQRVTAICTSTLEMGIDIGSVRSVGQVGPTWSVASLVQRLGRSGRHDGEPQILRIYTIDETPDPGSTITERLYPELVRAVALLELHREHWLEPPAEERFHFSTCVHQILSILRQTGGVPASHLHKVLCQSLTFPRIQPAQFSLLLRGLAARGLIEQIPTGELILAPPGELIVESRDFYAAFASSIEYRIEHSGLTIGVLSRDSVPNEGEFLLFGGKRWRVEMVDHVGKRVEVMPARGWRQPRFSGGVAGIHRGVSLQMKTVLSGTSGYPYVNSAGQDLLDMARRTFRAVGLDNCDIVETSNTVDWFPWCGSRAMQTLALCGKVDGLEVEQDDLCLRYKGLSRNDFLGHCGRIAEGAFNAETLVALMPELERDRFDENVPRELLKAAVMVEVLDLPLARTASAECVRST